MKDRMLDANFPRDADGRTYHVGTKPGEVANRIITVGDYTRARRIAAHFDTHTPVFEHESHRKFLTLTGTFNGTPLTVVAIGMGFSLVDFFVRECRAIVQGDMIVVRVGSCGSLSDRAAIGTVVVPYESIGVLRNYGHFDRRGNADPASSSEPYIITDALPCDQAVHDALLHALQSNPPPATSQLFGGNPPRALGRVKNASADSFYGSQGRLSALFDDENDALIDTLTRRHADLQTFEMETYLLNHLAQAANRSQSVRSGECGSMRTGAMQMIFANRATQDFITPEEVEVLERWCGRAVCEALASIDIPSERLHGPGVWSQS